MEAAKVDGEEERVEEDGGLRGSAAGDGTRARDSAGRLNRVMGASRPVDHGGEAQSRRVARRAGGLYATVIVPSPIESFARRLTLCFLTWNHLLGAASSWQ